MCDGLSQQPNSLGYQSVQIGMPVEMVTRKIRSGADNKGMLIYGYNNSSPAIPNFHGKYFKRRNLCPI